MADDSRPVEFFERVLLVEDDDHLAEALAEVLTYENCAADKAGNALEGLDRLRTGEYDAVICDLVMPRMDGEAFYRTVEQEFPRLANRFLFITGQAAHRPRLADFALSTGNELLEKPFDMEQLRASLRRLLRR